jgi:hypothetical protein
MKLVIINGPMGVGKTAAGKCIAAQNAGTAFIDGDWCMDLHPFVGNRETKEMAIDNILHMIGNYRLCSHCRMIVLVWLMDDQWVRERIMDGAARMSLDVQYVTLVYNRDELIKRWHNDHTCEWRTGEWLEVSLKSLPAFEQMENRLDTSGVSIEQVAEMILK